MTINIAQPINRIRLVTGSSLATVIKTIKAAMNPDQVRDFAKACAVKKAGKIDPIPTAKNLYNFVKNNIRYKKDTLGTEEIRTPARSWYDRFLGVDCEDYTIFICSCFMALEINCLAEIVDFGDGWAHIYPVLVLENGELIPLDPTPYPDGSHIPFGQYAKSIEKTMKVYLLEGLKGTKQAPTLQDNMNAIRQMWIEGVRHPSLSAEYRKCHYMNCATALSGPEEHEFLQIAMQHAIADVPLDLHEFKLQPGWTQEMLSGLEALVTGQIPDHITEELLSGFEDEELEGLGFLAGKAKRKEKKAARQEKKKAKKEEKKNKPKTKLKDKIKNAAKKATEFVKKNVNSAIKDVKKGVDKVVKFVKKTNPLMVLARGGLRIILHTNMFRLASKFKLAQLSQQEAMAKGLDIGEYNKLVTQYNKAKNMFVNDLGGKESVFIETIKKAKTGKYDKKKGFAGLGVAPAVAAGAPVAAGLPFGHKIIEWLKGIDFKKLLGKAKDILPDLIKDGESNDDPNDIPDLPDKIPGYDPEVGEDGDTSDKKPDDKGSIPGWIIPVAAVAALALLMK